MRQITSVNDLKDAISELEFNRAVHHRMLKDSFNSTIESLKPGNLLKNASGALLDPGVLANLIPAIVGLGAGIVSKNVTSNIASRITKGKKFRRILMSLAMYGITKAFVKNPRVSRLFGQKVFNTVFSH